MKPSYDKLVEAYLTNAECIQSLLQANEAIKQEVAVMTQTNRFAHEALEYRKILCHACGAQYEDEITLDGEDDYLYERYCSECYHDNLLIFDAAGKQYNFYTCEYEDVEV